MTSQSTSQHLAVLVDLNRCQSYGQCVIAAPGVFRLRGRDVIEFDYTATGSNADRVKVAAAACPVQAIGLTATGGPQQ